MGNKYLSEVIEEYKEEILGNNDMILISAGVGAGKNTWVQKELVKELKDDEIILFITSRKMIQEQALKNHAFSDSLKICIENHYHFVTTHQKLSAILINENDIYENIKKLEKLNFKYIVIDEVHSLIADSGFADSTYYISMLINYFLAQGKKIICMSATINSLSPYFRRYGNYKSFDFSNECYNVKPKNVEIINKEKAYELLSQANSKNKMVYMANSATDICKKFVPNLIKNYKVDKKNISISISDTKKDSLKLNSNTAIKEILDNMNTVNDYIVNNETLPEDINLLIATSKIKEGINLTDSNIKAMFCESHNPIDIIQFSGRYRKNVENFYIINNSYNQIQEEDILSMNIEYDLLHNIFLEIINLYHSILIYKTTKHINHFLKIYMETHHTDIDTLISNMHFTNATTNLITMLEPNVNNKNKKEKNIITKPKSNKNYTKSLKNCYTMLGFAYNKELNDFKKFITNKFSLLRYNPILDKYEIYSESYYYKLDSFESYKKYQEDSEKFIKDVLQIDNVSKNLPKFTSKDNKKSIKREILKLLSDNKWLNIRLNKKIQKTILDKINNTILNKKYQQLGRLLSAYDISFEKPGANKESYILITETFN